MSVEIQILNNAKRPVYIQSRSALHAHYASCVDVEDPANNSRPRLPLVSNTSIKVYNIDEKVKRNYLVTKREKKAQ